MTFDQALQLKKENGTTYKIDDRITGKLFVVPYEDEDLLRYVEEYRGSNFTDETAKLFSKNQEFKVCALWTDGANVIKKEIRP